MIQIAQDTLKISEMGKYQIANRVFQFDIENNTKFFTDLTEVISEVKKKEKGKKRKLGKPDYL